MGVIEEALLGAAFGALYEEIAAAKQRAVFFKRTLEHLKTTLENVFPTITQILKLENVSTDTCHKFLDLLKKTKFLVETYKDTTRWKLLKKRKVKKLILEMNASLERFMKYDFQVTQLHSIAIVDKYSVEIEREITKINKKMDLVIGLLKGNVISDSASEYEESVHSHHNATEQENFSRPEKTESGHRPKIHFHCEMGKGKCIDLRIFGRHVQE